MMKRGVSFHSLYQAWSWKGGLGSRISLIREGKGLEMDSTPSIPQSLILALLSPEDAVFLGNEAQRRSTC